MAKLSPACEQQLINVLLFYTITASAKTLALQEESSRIFDAFFPSYNRLCIFPIALHGAGAYSTMVRSTTLLRCVNCGTGYINNAGAQFIFINGCTACNHRAAMPSIEYNKTIASVLNTAICALSDAGHMEYCTKANAMVKEHCFPAGKISSLELANFTKAIQQLETLHKQA